MLPGQLPKLIEPCLVILYSTAVRSLIEVGLDELHFVLPLDMAPIVCPAKRSEFELDADAAEEEQMGGNGAEACANKQDNGGSKDEWIALYVRLNMLHVAVRSMPHSLATNRCWSNGLS